MNKKLIAVSLAVLAAGALVVFAADAQPKAQAADDQALVAQRIAIFDELDFNVFSKADWIRFHESHTEDVTVVWPDGHETHGIEPHIKDMIYMFSYAPDTKITAHPVKFGSGDWTAVIGEMTGTFSQPMVTADGKTIPPTGKTFKIQMATIAHWNGLKFDKEYLFWDNQTFMKQIGLAP